MKRTLPVDSNARKEIPMWDGCVRYFAAALAGVARWSKIGNDKHNKLPDGSINPELAHVRGKSGDHANCIIRHLVDIDDMVAYLDRECGVAIDGPSPKDCASVLDDADALAWRALALSQELHERFGGAPLAPAAKVTTDVPHKVDINWPFAKRPQVPSALDWRPLDDARRLFTHGRAQPARGKCECGDPACDGMGSSQHPKEPC